PDLAGHEASFWNSKISTRSRIDPDNAFASPTIRHKTRYFLHCGYCISTLLWFSPQRLMPSLKWHTVVLYQLLLQIRTMFSLDHPVARNKITPGVRAR